MDNPFVLRLMIAGAITAFVMVIIFFEDARQKREAKAKREAYRKQYIREWGREPPELWY
jgi:hypothetical protein